MALLVRVTDGTAELYWHELSLELADQDFCKRCSSSHLLRCSLALERSWPQQLFTFFIHDHILFLSIHLRSTLRIGRIGWPWQNNKLITSVSSWRCTEFLAALPTQHRYGISAASCCMKVTIALRNFDLTFHLPTRPRKADLKSW